MYKINRVFHKQLMVYSTLARYNQHFVMTNVHKEMAIHHHSIVYMSLHTMQNIFRHSLQGKTTPISHTVSKEDNNYTYKFEYVHLRS